MRTHIHDTTRSLGNLLARFLVDVHGYWTVVIVDVHGYWTIIVILLVDVHGTCHIYSI